MHEHESGSLWHQYLSIQFDLAHMLAELGFTIVFDLIILFLLWGKVLKPWLTKSIHKDIDAEHGIDHRYYNETPRRAPRPPYGAIVNEDDIPPVRRAERERQRLMQPPQPPDYKL